MVYDMANFADFRKSFEAARGWAPGRELPVGLVSGLYRKWTGDACMDCDTAISPIFGSFSRLLEVGPLEESYELACFRSLPEMDG